ncbi:MAG: glycerophosphodiester phosphodiesterase family protein [Candidatus Eremiobacterota bacterium]
MIPRLFGHRGCRAAPENTLAAFRRALELGAPALELDLHRTSDGHLVVMHDERVDRTTDGSGRIGSMTLAAVKRLKVDGGGEVPLLSEVLGLGASHLDLEVKGPERYPGIAQDIAREVRQAGMGHRVTVTSDAPRFLHEIDTVLPEATTGVVFRGMPVVKRSLKLGAIVAAAELVGSFFLPVGSLARLAIGLGAGAASTLGIFQALKRREQNQALAAGTDYLMPHWSLVDRHLVKRARADSKAVVPYTVDSPKLGKILVDWMGAHGVISNHPERFGWLQGAPG